MPKILLIDDDRDILMLMSIMLKKEGYEVDTASCRNEALSKMKDEKPCLILLDVLLSGADGRQLCREIKATEITKHIPVIMFSGHPEQRSNLKLMVQVILLQSRLTQKNYSTN